MCHRRAVLGVLLILLLGLGLSSAHAQGVPSIQLCGFTQFVDTIFINAIPSGDDTGRLYVTSGWEQNVPGSYKLLGPGGIVRGDASGQPVDLSVYVGGFFVVNSSANQFLGNPNCSLLVRLQDVSIPQLTLFTGTATVTCIGGPSDPFQILLNLTLSTCNQPGFPDSAEVAVARETLGPAGSAPNEYGTR